MTVYGDNIQNDMQISNRDHYLQAAYLAAHNKCTDDQILGCLFYDLGTLLRIKNKTKNLDLDPAIVCS